ncbi:MAG: hypothetical protein K6347_04385 [Campylobacterales bacterium]
MSATILKTIPLAGTNGEITISTIREPYGPGSHPVVSIGSTLKAGSEPQWKVHIPYENLEAVIEALQEASAAKK